MCGQSTRVDNRINTTNLDLSTVDTKESIDTSNTGKSQCGNSVLELHVIVRQRLIAKMGSEIDPREGALFMPDIPKHFFDSFLEVRGTKSACRDDRFWNSASAWRQGVKTSQLWTKTGCASVDHHKQGVDRDIFVRRAPGCGGYDKETSKGEVCK